MSLGAQHNKLYDAATTFFETLVEKAKQEESFGIHNYPHIYHQPVQSARADSLWRSTMRLHDHMLETQGPFGRHRRCHEYPFNTKLRKKRKYSKRFTPVKVMDRETLEYYMVMKRNDEPSMLAYHTATQYQVDQLCSGKQIKVNIISVIDDVFNMSFLLHTLSFHFTFCSLPNKELTFDVFMPVPILIGYDWAP